MSKHNQFHLNIMANLPICIYTLFFSERPISCNTMLTATFIVILTVNLATSGTVPQFLISTGVRGGFIPNPPNTPTTEVIDLVDEEVSCSNLEDFPVEIFGAVGANLGSVSIICGGGSDDVFALKQCYKLLEGGERDFFFSVG